MFCTVHCPQPATPSVIATSSINRDEADNPPIPPFVMGDLWEEENEADGDGDDDFIADLEIELEAGIEGVDFGAGV